MDLLRELSLTTRFMLLAKYTIGPVKILGGYEHMQFVNPKPLACGRVRRGGYTLGTVNNANFRSADEQVGKIWDKI
jgi:hypothetical protein